MFQQVDVLLPEGGRQVEIPLLQKLREAFLAHRLRELAEGKRIEFKKIHLPDGK